MKPLLINYWEGCILQIKFLKMFHRRDFATNCSLRVCLPSELFSLLIIFTFYWTELIHETVCLVRGSFSETFHFI